MHISLSDAVDRYVSRPTLRPPTREAYYGRLKLMVAHVGSEKDIADVHPFDLMRFAEHLETRENLKSDITYNNYIKQVQLFFAWCVDKARILDENPADILEYRSIDTGGEGWQPMPEAKYQQLLVYVGQKGRGYNPREEAFVRFLADTAVRCASAAALQWSDVDLKARTALIRHQKARGKHEHLVTWGDDCQQALADWFFRQKRRRGHNTVFSHNGRPIGTRSLNKFFRRLTEASGIGAHGTHSLRNRFGIRATRRYGIAHTAKLMNTSEAIVALHYVKESEESLLDLMRDLANHTEYTFSRQQTAV